MTKIMADAFYVGAYWGPREESVDDCAVRLSGQLSTLTGLDPLLQGWFKKGKSRKAALANEVDTSPDSLRALLLAGRQRRDDDERSVIADLGFSVGLWNGQAISVALSVHCGSGAAVQGMTSNYLTIQLPPAQKDSASLYRRDVALGLMRSVVTSWAPAWSTWTNHRLRSAQNPQPHEVVAGWATFVADGVGVQSQLLPVGAAVKSIGHGLLVVADGDADSASEAWVSAVRGALGPALRSTA
ncbi:Imm52 family immunity protein [Blastococcus sp. LR1]|uniref:Imm52 family immunity protein n=1 Tax=Blastococcus sp. LR1 TaxID=2877000 RepID=UPI001CC9E347|nr:Imm52 family immunity protein [Blastococcus sp. LR1]MCA0145760.1 hypothetical protein [Blastococcus sp. LR1]